VFGAIELIVVAIAVLFAIMLLERMIRERRVDLPEGVTLEREHASGLNLRDTLRGLRPRRASRRARPHDDGTPAAALRVMYWRFLALAERHRAGWREIAETPAEHAARISSLAPVWAEGAPIVRAFEDLRYGEEPPSPEVLERARAAFSTLEARVRAS
jgi:hypothetical protein